MSFAPGDPAPALPLFKFGTGNRAPQDYSDGWEVMLQSAEQQQESAAAPGEENVIKDTAQAVQDQVRQTIETAAGDRELRWPDRADLINYCRECDSIMAAVLLFFGIVYAAFGYTLFKMAATLNIAALGVWLGWLVGKQFDARLPAMVIGGVLFAALAWPAMRVAVALCSGIVGFVIGVAIWRALGMADNYAAAGGIIGRIFLFMLSFNLFKLSILAFTSAQGAVMFLGGLLGLLMKYPRVDEPVTHWTSQQPALLPITLLALSLLALLYQQHWHRAQPKEDDN